MVTKTQEQILQLLLGRPEERLSIRGIARLLGKSYTLTYNNVQGLVKQDFVEKQSIPPAQVIQLKDGIPTSVLVGVERKTAEIFLEKHHWIKLYLKDVLNATPPFFIMLVFGSYAKGTQTKESDLDLLIIVPAKEDIPGMEKAAQQYTNVKKGIVVVDAQNFTEMIKNPEELSVGIEAKKHHMLLYGTEPYYALVKRSTNGAFKNKAK
ncbi:Nucleotidyltransferase domain protein [uncultured archaeon]|nr:Nucleotidyltransferase domain protein [uncultured archaeon]